MATASATLSAELRSMGDEELLDRLKEFREELFNLRFQVATGQLDNNARLRTVRKGISRIYTVMRERELGITYVVVGDEATLAEASKDEAAAKSGRFSRRRSAKGGATETAAVAETEIPETSEASADDVADAPAAEAPAASADATATSEETTEEKA